MIAAPSVPVTPVHRICIAIAAERYHLPVWLLYGILATEATRPGQIVRDSNGTYDSGPMGINSIWLPTLARMGISPAEVRNDGCQNVAIGAWILARKMRGHQLPQHAFAHPRAFWRHVGDYNSATPHWNHRYRQRVADEARRVYFGSLEASHGYGH